MKSVNTFILTVMALAIAAVVGACVDPEGEIANPFYNFDADEHEHAWGEWVPIKEATCTEEGEAMRVCADDKFHIQKIIIPKDPEAHDYEAAEDADYIAPNCIESGFGFRVCTRCAAEVNGIIPPLGHKYDIYGLTAAATCTEPGRGFQICTRCSANETGVAATPPLGHEFETYEETTAPDCVTRKVETARCIRAGRGCDATDEHILDTDPDAHDWAEEYDAPTCAAEGCRWQVCTRCDTTGDEEIVAIDPNAHAWNAGAYVHPTCVDPGFRDQRCTLCAAPAENNGVIEALGHDFENNYQIALAPTCMAPGAEIAYCARRSTLGCQAEEEHSLDIDPSAHEWDTINDIITPATCTASGRIRVSCVYNDEHGGEQTVPALGHDWGSYETLTPAACTTTGTRRATCSRGDSTETQTVAALGHVWGEYIRYRNPTCTDVGLEISYCYRNNDHQQQQTPAALGHNWGGWYQPTATVATCMATGTQERTCTRNTTHRDTQPTAIDPNNHSYNMWTVEPIWTLTTAATCTANGIESTPCTRNANHTKGQRLTAIDPNNHSYSYSVTTTATCIATGTETGTCTRNANHTKATRATAIDPNNHNYGNWVTTAATCTTAGNDTRTCSRSSAHKETQPGAAALGHNYSWKQTTAATCTTAGSRDGTCTRDSAHKTTETIAALGHHWDEWTWVWDYGGYVVATCAAGAEQYRWCHTPGSNHVETRISAVDPNGHVYEWVYTGVTETENGTRQKVCKYNASHPKGAAEIAYATGTPGLRYTVNFDETACSVSNGSTGSSVSEVYIPAYTLWNDRYIPVTVISVSAFTNKRTSLTKVSGMENITEIGGSAFEGCTNLTEVRFSSNNLRTIGISAFAGCTSLNNSAGRFRVIPNGVTSVGNLAFRNCTSLPIIVIPASVTYVGHYAFSGLNSNLHNKIYVYGKADFAATKSAGWGSWNSNYYQDGDNYIGAVITYYPDRQ